MVVGGGRVVEALRRQHRQWPVAEAFFHRRALAQMDDNAELCAQWTQFPTIADPAELQRVTAVAWWAGSARLADIAVLEPSWNTTSDAVASWLGWIAGAPVMLAKSVWPPGKNPWRLQLSRQSRWGYAVDASTPYWIGQGVAVWWVGPKPPGREWAAVGEGL